MLRETTDAPLSQHDLKLPYFPDILVLSMSAPILSVASTSLQLVISAYEQVKSNKERCRNLVERCELLVSRLSYIVDQRGEDIEAARIEQLQEAFEHIIQTMTRVGTRGWFKVREFMSVRLTTSKNGANLLQMVISAESDALAIDGCHRRISDLISMFNVLNFRYLMLDFSEPLSL